MSSSLLYRYDRARRMPCAVSNWFRRHDGLERALLLDPHLGAIDHTMLLELEGSAVVAMLFPMYFSLESTSRTVARVHSRPRSVWIPRLFSRSAISDSARLSSNEPMVDLIDDGDLVVWTELQDDPVDLQTLVLAAC